MYRRDYILRLIERFGRMLIALRNRIQRRELETADLRAEIGEVAQQAGLDLEIARTLDPGSLLMWLAPTGEIDEPRLWLMAELLYLEGLHAISSATGEGRRDLERALAIYSRLPPEWKPSDDFPTATERISELRRLLHDDRAAAGTVPVAP
jgi:hypothetical protein